MYEKRWTWNETRVGNVISKEGFRVKLMPQRGNLLVSGNLKTAFRHLGLDLPILGMEGPAQENFALAVGRNKVLVSTQKQIEVQNGWHNGGFMMSSVDFQWKQLSLEGHATRMVLAQGIAHNLTSPSCITQIFGKTSIVVKSETGYFLFVEAPYLQYYTDCLNSATIFEGVF